MHTTGKADSFAFMNHSVFVRFAISLGLMLALSFGWSSASGMPLQAGEEQRANLALRAIGHQLLLMAGDSTSAVPPVQEIEPGLYFLPLESAIQYDSLKGLVDRVLKQYGLPRDYSLALYDCHSDDILLGYVSQSGSEIEQACNGRAQNSDCYRLSIRFPQPAPIQASGQWPWLALLFVFVGTGLGFLLRGPVKAKSLVHNEHSLSTQKTLGRLTVDFDNQLAWSPEGEQRLTFQEAKLLSLFWQNPNRVLRREEILEQVWGDEGVIVGRSVDVFVSRLRKVLKPEPAMNLVSIHGVGYKLEVAMEVIS